MQKKNKKDQKFKYTLLLQIGELGLLIALPLLGFILLGKYLDTKLSTTPLFILLGVVFSLGTSTLAIMKFVKSTLNQQ